MYLGLLKDFKEATKLAGYKINPMKYVFHRCNADYGRFQNLNGLKNNKSINYLTNINKEYDFSSQIFF